MEVVASQSSNEIIKSDYFPVFVADVLMCFILLDSNLFCFVLFFLAILHLGIVHVPMITGGPSPWKRSRIVSLSVTLPSGDWGVQVQFCWEPGNDTVLARNPSHVTREHSYVPECDAAGSGAAFGRIH